MKRAYVIIQMILIFIVSLIAYIFIHEVGHCLIALSCGATITDFSIVGRYMSYSGGSFSASSYALQHISGVVLPAIISIVLLIYRGKSFLYNSFTLCFGLNTVFFAGALQAWIVVPLLSNPSASDDVIKFIAVTGISPVIVSLSALFVTVAMIFLVFKKRYNVVKEQIIMRMK